MICIPGPCAATTALVSSGLPSSRFCFEGFLPVKGKERRQRLEQIATEPRTTVLYEAPHRLLALLQSLAEHCGSERPLQVARELTKRHEQQVGPTIAAALEHFHTARPQGEFTLVLGGVLHPFRRSPMRTSCWSDCRTDRCGGKPVMPLGSWRNDSGISRRRLYSLLHQDPAD